MRGFRFRSSQARTACVVDKRDGWVLAKFFFFFFRVFMDRDALGTRGLFFRATTSFVGRRPRTRAAKPREKTSGTQGISICENAKTKLANIQPSRLS